MVQVGWQGQLIESHRTIAVSSASLLLSVPTGLRKRTRRQGGRGRGSSGLSQHQHFSIASRLRQWSIRTGQDGLGKARPVGARCASTTRIATGLEPVAVVLYLANPSWSRTEACRRGTGGRVR